tara:strand:+ start:1497 stop:2537 length:1041 start_codon:yes stop_codon:yes gene_type:complete
MSTDKKNTEEEVDLGSLFIIIGKGFSNFFNFIGKIFKGLFHISILLLFFIKKHFLKFFIAAIVGGGLGFYMESVKETMYGSHLVVQPNFNSSGQLYTNVNYYNRLVLQNNINELINVFGITEEEAISLRRFVINPIKDNNDVIRSYNNLILNVDSLSIKEYSFNDFKRNVRLPDYRTHVVQVYGINNAVFYKLGKTIISSISDNQFFDRYKQISNRQLNRTDSILNLNLSQIDSLKRAHMQAIVEGSKKEFKGTNISLSDKEINSTRQVDLYNISQRINERLNKVSEIRAEKFEVINVITDFQRFGYVVNPIQKNYIFLFPILFILIVLTFVLLIDLNKFLENYKK